MVFYDLVYYVGIFDSKSQNEMELRIKVIGMG